MLSHFKATVAIVVLVAIGSAGWWWWTHVRPGGAFIVLVGRSASEDPAAVRSCARQTIERAIATRAPLVITVVGRPAQAALETIPATGRWSPEAGANARSDAREKAETAVMHIMHAQAPKPGASDQLAAIAVAARAARAHGKLLAKPTVVLCADGHATGPGYNFYRDTLDDGYPKHIDPHPTIVPTGTRLVIGAAGMDIKDAVPAVREAAIERVWRALAARWHFATPITYDSTPFLR